MSEGASTIATSPVQSALRLQPVRQFCQALRQAPFCGGTASGNPETKIYERGFCGLCLPGSGFISLPAGASVLARGKSGSVNPKGIPASSPRLRGTSYLA